MKRADLIVVGAGPAGASAALAAENAGLEVVLVDEAPAIGGQVYRAPAPELRRAARDGADEEQGDALRAAVAASCVQARLGRRVWSIAHGFRVDAIGPDGPEGMEAPRLLAATGAVERVVPFPGWTLPGVIGLAGATILLKTQAIMPGRRVVVAGCGPLLAAVAAKIVKEHGEVAAVVDLSSVADWARTVPRLATRPGTLGQGFHWMLTLGRHRIPILFRHAVRRAEGQGCVERVVVGPVRGDGYPAEGPERSFVVDSLTVGHGLVPGSDIPRLLGARHVYRHFRGGWIPEIDNDGRTTVDGLYVAGDGAGIAGAAPAAAAGRLAGLAAALDAGRLVPGEYARRRASATRELARAMRFANGIAALMTLRPGLVRAIPSDAVVCRCEDVTRGEIESAIEAGASDVNQLKHFTRCGMGPCQGRMCGDVVGALVANHVGSREAAGQFTMRPPLRPVPLDALTGNFTYADIPVPEPAPL